MPDLVETPDNEPAMQAAQILNRHSEKTPNKNKDMEATTPEVRNLKVFIMSMILYVCLIIVISESFIDTCFHKH